MLVVHLSLYFEHLPRVLAVHVAKVGVIITCQTLQEKVRTMSLKKSSGVGCFLQLYVDYHDHINGSLCIVDSIAGKMGPVCEQNVMNHMGVRINPTA